MATYNKIQVEDKNEGEKIAWAQSKTKIIFGDDDLAIRCDTRQRDIPVTVDVCMDDQNNLTIGTGTGRYYVAQVEIPAQVSWRSRTAQRRPRKPQNRPMARRARAPQTPRKPTPRPSRLTWRTLS